MYSRIYGRGHSWIGLSGNGEGFLVWDCCPFHGFVVQDEVIVQQEEENVEQAEEKKSLKGRFGLYMIESYVDMCRDLL